MTKTKQTESVIGILINSKTHSLCNILFYFDFRATLPLEMSLLSHTYTFIVHLSEQMLFFVQVSTETFSSNIVVVVTSCSHMPSQLQSIYHSQNPPIIKSFTKTIEYTHTDTNPRPELHKCTNIQIQVFLADTHRFISFISLLLQEHIHSSK